MTGDAAKMMNDARGRMICCKALVCSCHIACDLPRADSQRISCAPPATAHMISGTQSVMLCSKVVATLIQTHSCSNQNRHAVVVSVHSMAAAAWQQRTFGPRSSDAPVLTMVIHLPHGPESVHYPVHKTDVALLHHKRCGKVPEHALQNLCAVVSQQARR